MVATGFSPHRLFAWKVSHSRCSQAVLKEGGLILNCCGFERHRILGESESKIAMLSGRVIYVIAPLQL
jgi:hypothetical protein